MAQELLRLLLRLQTSINHLAALTLQRGPPHSAASGSADKKTSTASGQVWQVFSLQTCARPDPKRYLLESGGTSGILCDADWHPEMPIKWVRSGRLSKTGFKPLGSHTGFVFNLTVWEEFPSGSPKLRCTTLR